MEGVINEFYRGMDIICYPNRSEENKDNNSFKQFWRVEAWYNGEIKGSLEYNSFRLEPKNSDSFNTYFSALPEEIKQSGRDLVDRIISESMNAKP